MFSAPAPCTQNDTAVAARRDPFPITPNDYQPHGVSSIIRSCARWNETFPHTPSYREVTPPQPVTINLDQALARDNPPLRTTNPLRVSAAGLRLTGYCTGQLHAWVRLTTGTWLGKCTFTVHSGNHRAALELRQWLPAGAITPQQH